MGNSHQKNPLRKAQSVPESQFLQETNPDFVRNKSRASARLHRGKSHEQLENDVSIPDKPKWNNVPLVEALFLPDFPVRGDFTQQEFEESDKGKTICIPAADEDVRRREVPDIEEESLVVDIHRQQECR